MNILFDINHPAHVHLFKNAIRILESQGHHVFITARDKDVTLPLLNSCGFRYQTLSKAHKGIIGLGWELLLRQFRLLPILLKNHVQVCVSVTGACSVHVCKVLAIPTLVFYDTEHATLQNKITVPFATYFFTPQSFIGRWGKNHLTYNSLHDLAYLHPKYFQPAPDIYQLLGISEQEKFVIIRFVSWQAAHDIGQKGMSLDLKRQVIEICQQYARVFIVSETPLPPEFELFRCPLPADKIHDALAFATLYIGEGGSMATEAAVLGTPAIFISSLTAGVFEELESKYELMYSFTPQQLTPITESIESLLKNTLSKNEWQIKRERLLHEKIDLSDWMVKRIIASASRNEMLTG